MGTDTHRDRPRGKGRCRQVKGLPEREGAGSGPSGPSTEPLDAMPSASAAGAAGLWPSLGPHRHCERCKQSACPWGRGFTGRFPEGQPKDLGV